MEHLTTVEGPAMVVDLWEHHGRGLAVVTVRPGINLATAQPFLPDWDALAWETDPGPDPAARLAEALRQGHLRHRERHTGERGLVPLPRQ